MERPALNTWICPVLSWQSVTAWAAARPTILIAGRRAAAEQRRPPATGYPREQHTIHMRLLFVTVALSTLAATASANLDHPGEIWTDLDLWPPGNKCVTSSVKLPPMDLGACGAIPALSATGVCARNQEDVEKEVKLARDFFEVEGYEVEEDGISTSECKTEGQEFANWVCAAATAHLGEKIQVKAGLDACKIRCDYLKHQFSVPAQCMSDSHCPTGVTLKICCQSVIDMMKEFCDETAEQNVHKANLAKLAFDPRIACSNDKDVCYSWLPSSAGRYSVSMVFVVVVGWLAVLLSSYTG
jgi:hypothetical protein